MANDDDGVVADFANILGTASHSHVIYGWRLLTMAITNMISI